MKTTWNDGQQNRDRQARVVLVTEDGNVHPFLPHDNSEIPGVARGVIVNFNKAGKWSNSTWEISHRESTSVVSWHEDFETGKTFPQANWEKGYLWLAGKAPLLQPVGFDKFVRQEYPKVAEEWDKSAAADREFGGETSAELKAQIEQRKIELVQQEKATRDLELLAREKAGILASKQDLFSRFQEAQKAVASPVLSQDEEKTLVKATAILRQKSDTAAAGNNLGNAFDAALRKIPVPETLRNQIETFCSIPAKAAGLDKELDRED